MNKTGGRAGRACPHATPFAPHDSTEGYRLLVLTALGDGLDDLTRPATRRGALEWLVDVGTQPFSVTHCCDVLGIQRQMVIETAEERLLTSGLTADEIARLHG